MYTKEGRVYLPYGNKRGDWFVFNTRGNLMWHKAGLLQVKDIEVWLLAIV